MKMKRHLLACALAVGLGSVSWATAPTDAGIQPHAQVQMIYTRYCLSVHQGACMGPGIFATSMNFSPIGTSKGFRFLRAVVRMA